MFFVIIRYMVEKRVGENKVDNGGKKELTDQQRVMMQKAMARGKEIVEFFNLGVNLRLGVWQ